MVSIAYKLLIELELNLVHDNRRHRSNVDGFVVEDISVEWPKCFSKKTEMRSISIFILQFRTQIYWYFLICFAEIVTVFLF